MKCLLENLFFVIDYYFSCKMLMRNELNISRLKDCLLFVFDGGLDFEEFCIWFIDLILNNWENLLVLDVLFCEKYMK